MPSMKQESDMKERNVDHSDWTDWSGFILHAENNKKDVSEISNGRGELNFTTQCDELSKEHNVLEIKSAQPPPKSCIAAKKSPV